MSHTFNFIRPPSLIQKQFIVSAGNPSLVPVIGSDTLCVIQKSLFIVSADSKDLFLVSVVLT
jgi:hypothetical protein